MPLQILAIHLNYTDYKEMEMVVPVWEGDAVAIKKGYHYNVASPGTIDRISLDDGSDQRGERSGLYTGDRSNRVRWPI